MNKNKIICSSSPLKKGIIGESHWFTLIEIMIWILISSMIIIIWFQALNAIMVWKVKLIESTNIEKESFKFAQKFFEEIKKGWLIDYEEYFNRKVVWNTSFSWWHFDLETLFWNSWSVVDGFYYCRSWNWLANKMWSGWCLTYNLNNVWKNQNWEKQRYGQYSFQFIDYNSNYDDDKDNNWNTLLWDENSDSSIIWDDDDEYLGNWPSVFESGTWVTELYLISADKKRRTFFRWTVKNDPNKPSSKTCDFSNQKKPVWEWCLGTIEFLKLDWKDWWFDHSNSSNDNWENDWVVDSWLINKDFVENAWDIWNKLSWDKYWIPLFPNSINIKSFEVRAYPNKNIKQAWKETGIDLSPYIRINMTLTPSWKVRKKIKWKVPEFNISTTVNLTDIFSR